MRDERRAKRARGLQSVSTSDLSLSRAVLISACSTCVGFDDTCDARRSQQHRIASHVLQQPTRTHALMHAQQAQTNRTAQHDPTSSSSSRMSSPVSVDAVNKMCEAEFVETFSMCYNGSSTCAPTFATFALRAAYAERPFATRRELFRALSSPLFFGDKSDVAALLRDREPLGNKRPESHAGLPAWEAKSNAEHASVGLHRLEADEFELMAELNRRYREKHGFTFILRAAGRTKAEIIATLARRLENSTEDEQAIAVRQYSEIIELRLNGIVQQE